MAVCNSLFCTNLQIEGCKRNMVLLNALLFVCGPLFQLVPPIFPHFPPVPPIFLVFPFFFGCITGCITSPPGRVILLPVIAVPLV